VEAYTGCGHRTMERCGERKDLVVVGDAVSSIRMKFWLCLPGARGLAVWWVHISER